MSRLLFASRMCGVLRQAIPRIGSKTRFIRGLGFQLETRNQKLQTPPSRRRGGVYLAVLGTSAMITLIGVSALLAVQVQRRAGEAAHEATEARLHARSAIELALAQLASDPNWRTTYTHNTWTTPQALGQGTCSFKLVDAADTSLSNNTSDSAWLYGRGGVGDAVRITRVLLRPMSQIASPNLLRNGDIEAGTRHWIPDDSSLAYTLDTPHAGAGSLLIANRGSVSAGVRQDVTEQLPFPGAYRLDAWVRMRSGSDGMVLLLYTRGSGDSGRWASVSVPTVRTNWTRISVTLTANWTGPLELAQWKIQAQSGTGDFLLDDAVLTPIAWTSMMMPVPGTWEQVVE